MDDLNEIKLPHNRKELFFHLFKSRFSLLIRLGLIILCFSIPLFFIRVMENINVSLINSNTIDEVEKASSIFQTINIANFLKILGYVILFIGFSGVFEVVRKLAFSEGVIFKYDFTHGIKTNILSYSLFGFIFGSLRFLVEYSIRNDYFNHSNLNELLIILSISAIIIFFPMMIIGMIHKTTYVMKDYMMFKNAFLLSMKTFFVSLPVYLLSILPFFLLYISNIYVFVISILVITTILYPIFILLFFVYTDSIFDKYINKDNFKEIYRKGIY